MSTSSAAGTARQFVASREVFSTAWIKGTKIWQVVYSVFFFGFVGFAALSMFGATKGHGVHAPRYTGPIILAVLAGASVVMGVYFLWRWRQKFVLSVSGDALTVGSRGEVYSIADAQFGIWPNIGVALHMHSGGRRFVLGGEERNIGPETPLDAPPIPVVDARLPAAEFDELLRLGGRTAVRGPAPGEPVRCILFPNALTVNDAGALAFRKKQRLVNPLTHAQLFLDVDRDTIRVVEPQSHAVTASAAVGRITATPSTYETRNDETASISRTAALRLAIPGMPPLDVGCTNAETSGPRFRWPGNVPKVGVAPTYVLSAADWRTLVEKFGLPRRIEFARPAAFFGLAALAAELPPIAGRALGPRPLGAAAVLVIGPARRLRVLALQRFTKLTLVVVLGRLRFRLRLSHSPQPSAGRAACRRCARSAGSARRGGR